MKKALSLSIIIPVYNEESHLAACLDAIATQTVKPDEVIVVDNNSTDKSVEITKRYPFVRLISEQKQGVQYARNRGFTESKADLLGRIDADTQLPPDWTANVHKIMNNQHTAAANGPVFYYDMPFSPKNYWIDHQIRVRLYKADKRAPFLFGSNSVIRRSAWLAVKDSLCHTKKIHEDLDLAIHLYRQDFPIAYDKRLLAGTSARRYDDKFSQFRHYMGMYLYSYQHHGINRLSPRIATGLYWIGYVITRWFRKGKTTPRKNPMG